MATPLKQTEVGRAGYQYCKTLRDAGSIMPLSFKSRVNAVSCAAFVLKRLRQLAHVCMRCVCACVRCMCAFARAVRVCELKAAWHMRTDQFE